MSQPNDKRRVLKKIQKAINKAVRERVEKQSRQIPYEDPFANLYAGGVGARANVLVLQPPYLFERLYSIYEESGLLQACIGAYKRNIDGYGYEIVSVDGVDGQDKYEKNPQYNCLVDFFRTPNGDESFNSLRMNIRHDYEISGNGFLEVYRDHDNKPSMVYWMDAKHTRVCARDDEYTEVEQTIIRNGKEIPVTVKKRFRRYAQSYGQRSDQVVYFKTYGDPRTMDADTGEYTENTDNPATEVIHFKNGTDTYGVPRWIGHIKAILGTIAADFVNFDLFDSQGIPPLLVQISNGQLTDDALEDLLNLFQQAKGVRNFNKLLLLEAEGFPDASGSVSTPKIDVQNLTEARKEDAMFLSYLKDSRDVLRSFGFQLPEIYLGLTTDYRHESAEIARQIAEDQVFQPIRSEFDEVVNNTLVRDLEVTEFVFKTNAATIKQRSELSTLLPKLIESGIFTVDGLINFVNDYYGLEISPYDEEWANRPIPEALTKMKPVTSLFGGQTGGNEGDDEESGDKKTPEQKALDDIRIYAALANIEHIIQKHANAEERYNEHVHSHADTL